MLFFGLVKRYQNNCSGLCQKYQKNSLRIIESKPFSNQMLIPSLWVIRSQFHSCGINIHIHTPCISLIFHNSWLPSPFLQDWTVGFHLTGTDSPILNFNLGFLMWICYAFLFKFWTLFCVYHWKIRTKGLLFLEIFKPAGLNLAEGRFIYLVVPNLNII
jgi:hypothetical protein